MVSDEFYYEYLGKSTLSSSLVKKLLKGPKSYKNVVMYREKPNSAMLTGRLLHSCILEPHKFEEYKFIDVQSRNTKKFKDELKKDPYIFTQKEKEDAERLADAFLRNDLAKSYLVGSEFEVPEIGMIEGIPFRAKADIFNREKNLIIDVKTTADTDDFQSKYSRSGAYKLRYDVQVYIYCTLFNVPFSNFLFITIDKKTLEIGKFDVTENFYKSGMLFTNLAIQRYKNSFYGKNIEEVDLDNFTKFGTLD